MMPPDWILAKRLASLVRRKRLHCYSIVKEIANIRKPRAWIKMIRIARNRCRSAEEFHDVLWMKIVQTICLAMHETPSSVIFGWYSRWIGRQRKLLAELELTRS